jgi:hypothetical protein
VTQAGRIMSEWWQGDDLADARILDAYHVMQEWRSAHSYPLSLVTPSLRSFVTQVGTEVDVAQRLKRLPQIINKLGRLPTMRLPQMEDIAGCRAILADNAEVEAVAARLDARWDVHHVSDYRTAGKPGTGYRAVHYIVLKRGHFVEVQLRTAGQHRWAEEVERAQDRTGIQLKDGLGPAELVEYFRVASEIIWRREMGFPDDAGLSADLAKLRAQVVPYFRARE